MATTTADRAARLAAEFASSRLFDAQAAIDGAAHRKNIVTEMLSFMSTREVAYELGISVSRVSQIVGGVKGE